MSVYIVVKMFFVTSQIFYHTTFNVDKVEDMASFLPAPVAYPKKRFRVITQFIFRHNDVTIRNHKANNESIQDISPEYSSTTSDTYTDRSKNPTNGRLMLEGASLNEKLEQTDLKIAAAKVGFQNAMEKLHGELTLAKNV
jgi:hydroxyacyl-ACP dehydratase HTD2-like protein with hotdog domain